MERISIGVVKLSSVPCISGVVEDEEVEGVEDDDEEDEEDFSLVFVDIHTWIEEDEHTIESA